MNRDKLFELWKDTCKEVIKKSKESHSAIKLNEWWLQKTLQDKLKKHCQKEHPERIVIREMPLKYMWDEDEDDFRDQSFPWYSEGTDIVITQRIEEDVVWLDEYNSFKIKDNNIQCGNEIQNISDKTLNQIKNCLDQATAFIEIKFFEWQKQIDKGKPKQRCIIDSCYFCSGRETSSENKPKGENATDQFICNLNNEDLVPTYRKEGQIIWDFFRIIRAIVKKDSCLGYLLVLIKIPKGYCDERCGLSTSSITNDHDKDNILCKLIILLKKYQIIYKEKYHQFIKLNRCEQTMQKNIKQEQIECEEIYNDQDFFYMSVLICIKT